MAKPRVNIRISTKLYAQLCEAADKPGVTKTAIVEDARGSIRKPARFWRNGFWSVWMLMTNARPIWSAISPLPMRRSRTTSITG